MRRLQPYLGRFALPVGLLVAALCCWVLANRLTSTERASAEPADNDPVAPLVSVRRLPAFATSSTRTRAIDTVLSAVPADPGGLSCTTILVDGEPVLDVRGEQALVPAYAQMLITAHAAIEILGPNHRFETQAFAEDLPDLNGRLFNGLYLIGGGDPGLMSAAYARGLRPIRATRTPIEELATAVAESGVLRIDGGIIGVERRFDNERSLPGWPESYVTSGVLGPLSALQLDDAFVERPAANLGVAVPASEPATMAAERFADQLWDIDVQVFGEYRTFAIDEELPDLVPVGRVFSPPLTEIVLQTLAVNDATAAEMLLKEIGVAAEGAGTTQAGGQAVQDVLQTLGIDVPVPFRDGSGLDPVGGTTCQQLATTADAIPNGHATLSVLPGHDLPGVFDGRFGDVAVQADLRVVGGSHLDASGFVARTADDGPRVTISSIVNRSGGPTDSDLAYQRALVELVDALREATTVAGVTIGD